MSKRKLRLVIGAASLALAGILFIQGFWIHRAWRIYLFNYNHRIHQAAIHSASRLERSHLKEFLKNKRQNAFLKLHVKDSNVESNTVVVDRFIKGDSKTKIIVVNGDTVEQRVYSENRIPPASDEGIIWRTLAEDIEIEELISDSVISLALKSIPIDSIINAELDREGVDLSYTYEIIGTDSSKQNTFKIRKRGNAMVPLFRHTSGDVPYFLRIRTDLNKAELPYWFIAMIALSILFSGTMIWAFWFVIQGLLQQKKISEVKTDFINNMTHEFKTPISTISLAVDAMKLDQVKGDKAQIEYYSGIIGEENTRMDRQVERVLQASQLEKGELLIKQKKVDLVPIIEKVVSHFSLILEEKGGLISIQNRVDSVFISGDEHHLFNVFSNLIDNAIKYCESAPVIVLNIHRSNNSITISVKDNGIGMSKEQQKHLFKKFYRANKGDLHDVKGFGLGLNYVQYIVLQHGGKIEVNSQVGLGSEFKIILSGS